MIISPMKVHAMLPLSRVVAIHAINHQLLKDARFFSLHFKWIYRVFLLLISAVLLNVLPSAYAHEQHAVQTTLAQQLAFDADGTAWRVSVAGMYVAVDRSHDLAKTFSQPILLNLAPQTIKAQNEERPQIAVGPNGYIYVIWTESRHKRKASYVWFSRSVNQGRSFEKPMLIDADQTEALHAYANLNVSAQGTLTVSWLNARDEQATARHAESTKGAALYFAQSFDHGATFSQAKKLTETGCECCRLASTNKPDGRVTLLWRAIFEHQERDHMMAEMPEPSQPVALHRASFGHWQVEGCPHHGPAIASGGKAAQWWGYHLAYYDGQDKKPGLYYARMDGEAWASSVPKRIGRTQYRAGHPALFSVAEKVWLVWREIVDNQAQILGMYSEDDGKNWTEAKLLLTSDTKIDYPQLLAHQDHVYLFVNTAKSGVKLIPINHRF